MREATYCRTLSSPILNFVIRQCYKAFKPVVLREYRRPMREHTSCYHAVPDLCESKRMPRSFQDLYGGLGPYFDGA